MAKNRQKPRIRKPNSNQRRYNRYASTVASDYGLVFVSGSGGVDLVNFPSMKIARFSDRRSYDVVCRALNEIQYRWSILMGVACVDDNGNRYLKSEEIELQEPRFNRELAYGFRDHHVAMKNNVNQRHLRSMCWIAYPGRHEFDDDLAFSTFEKFGAWEVKNGTQA